MGRKNIIGDFWEAVPSVSKKDFLLKFFLYGSALNRKSSIPVSLRDEDFLSRFEALRFLQNRHAGTLCLDYLIAGRDCIERIGTYVASEKVNSLLAASTQSYILIVEIIGVTFLVLI